MASFAHRELNLLLCPDHKVNRRSLLGGDDPLCVGRPMAVGAIDGGVTRGVSAIPEKLGGALSPVGCDAVDMESGRVEVRP